MNEGLTLDQRLPDDEGRQPSRSLLFWLIWALIVFVILFACGSLAMLIENQQDRVEIQPAIQADYGVWPDSVRFGAVNLDLLEEIGRDRGFKISYSEGVSDGCFLPGSCNTATPTSSPYPTATATVTDVPTITQTPTATPSPTSTFPPTFTPTVTNTPVPPTNTPTSTPIVWPLKLVNPGNVDPEGDVVSVTILVVNYGNLTGAELTRVTDRLPAGMTFVPGSCSMSPGPVVPCSATGSEVSWSFSPARIIPHTRFITFTLQANISGISAGDVLTNIAETEGDNFATATYHRRIYAYTPTPTSTPITIPNAVDDAYSTTEDLPLIVSTPGLLSNDTDASWDTLTTTLDTPPSHGIAVVNLDGSFSYTPTANYFGTDSFTYLACDAGASCDGATVDLMINAVPDSPNAQDDSYSVDEDQSLSISAAGVLINDVDPDNLVPPLWSGLVVNSSPLVGPSHAAVGSFTLNADGSFTYSPAPDYFGPDQFTYQVCDTPLPGSCDTATAYITVNSVNDLPVALDDFSSTDEDVGVTIDVLSNDSDVLDGDPLSVDSVTQGGHGSVTHTAGDVTYTPDANWFGTDTFTYTISDGNGGFATASVEVTVNSVNDDPVAVDDPWPATPPILIGQGGTIRVDVWSNDYEDPVEGDSLYVGAILSPPASGGLSTAVIDDAGSPGYVLDDHSVIYTPDPAFHDPTNPDTFVYELNDDAGGMDQATVSIFVNDAPTAFDDAYVTDEDTLLNPDALAGVIQAAPNPDSDPNGDPLTASLVSAPLHAASFTLNPDGSFSYLPALHYNGSDGFTYLVTDGGLDSAPATVTITINPMNDAPVAQPDSIRTNQGTDVDIDVLANDTDIDLDALIVENVSGLPSRVTNNGSDVTFSPLPPDIGIYNFSYDACDRPTGDPDQLCSTATVDVFVSGPPAALNDSYSTVEDTPLIVNALAGVLDNDTDLDGDPLTAVWQSGPLNGLVGLNPDGSFTYTPDAEFNGRDTFTYQACDPGGAPPQPQLCDPATVTIQVDPTNDPPTALDDATTIIEDTSTPIVVLSNDFDVDGLIDPSSVQVVVDPQHGSATPNLDGTVTYDPDWNYSGSDTFGYTVDDDLGATSNVATVTVNVQPVNDAPLAQDDAYATGQRTYMEMSFLYVPPGSGVLANDVEPDGQAMTVTNMTDPPNHTPWATLAWQWDADGSFRYAPVYEFHGLDSFTYTVCDPTPLCDTGTVRIAVNDPPQAGDDVYSTDEDTGLSVSAPGVLDNDSDPNSTPPADVIAASLFSGPSNGSVSLNADGSFTYDPDPDYEGPDSFTYEVCDQGVPPIQNPLCDTGSVDITVNPVNDPPIAVDDSARTNEGTDRPIDVLTNDYENPVEGDTLSVAAVTQASNGSVTFTPTDVTYSPDPGFYGLDTFTYTLSDGNGGTDTASVDIFVSTIPSAADDVGYTMLQDETLNVAAAGVLLNDSDPDGDPLTANLLSGPTHAQSFSLAPDGSFNYTPDQYFYGTDSFTYQACDPGSSPQPQLCDPAVVSITIQDVPDAPVAQDDSYAVDEDQSLNVDSPGGPGVMANDADPDNLPPFVPPGYVPWSGLSVTTTPLLDPSHGALTLNADGSFLYVPDADYAGTDIFSYEVCDSPPSSQCDSAVVHLTVSPVNDPPSAFDDTASTNEDTPATISVLANDSDPDAGDVLSIDSVTQGAHGSVVIGGNAVTYTPAANWFGSDSFTYTITDGNGEFDTAAVDVTVQSVNDNPVANDDSRSMGSSGTLIIDVLGNDSDVENDLLSVHSVGPTTGGGTVTNNGSDVTFDPNGYSSPSVPATFTYRAVDSNGGVSNDATVTVLVNDPPYAGNDSYSTDEDVLLAIDASVGVLANDYDPNSDPLSISLVSDVNHGSLTLNNDGSFSYQPASNYFGPDTFTYQICDAPAAGYCTNADVSIDVFSVNDVPVAADDSASADQVVAMSGTWSLPVSINDNDIENELDLDSIVITSGPAHGSAVPNPASPGEILYTLGDGHFTSDSFTYTISDLNGAVSNAANVTISITPPSIHVDKTYSPDPVVVGGTVEFYITVWNNGPGVAYDVDLADDLGSCFQWNSGQNPNGSLGDFNDGDAVVVVARAQVLDSAGCGATNSASLTSTNALSSSVSISIGIDVPPSGERAQPTPTPTPDGNNTSTGTGGDADVEAAFTLLIPVFLVGAPFILALLDHSKGRQ